MAQKKRESVTLTRPTPEAFALPIVKKRATQRASQICIYQHIEPTRQYWHDGICSTPLERHLLVTWFVDDLKVAKFQESRTSACKRFLICHCVYAITHKSRGKNN